jgi:RNA polymerase sigma-70 factor, ECF subfamily
MRLPMRHTHQKKELNDAFVAIYTDHSDAIFRFSCSRVSDREQALDITQEVFSRLWQSLIDGKDIEYPKTFLFTIARNLIIDWYRKKKSVSLEGLASPETDEPYEPVPDDAETLLEMDAEGRFLVDKIGKLSSGYRDAVYLRFVEGLSPTEIAKIIGVSVNATSVRINRGVDELRKLTGYDIEDK